VTPYLILVLAAYAIFMTVLAIYSTRAMIDDARATRPRKRR
jgi:hypothetical protein